MDEGFQLVQHRVSSKSVKLIGLEAGERVIGAARLPEAEEEEASLEVLDEMGDEASPEAADGTGDEASPKATDGTGDEASPEATDGTEEE